MAKATKKAEIVTYSLELTEREAIVLKELVGSICGAMIGPRASTDDIYNALDDAGVKDWPTDSNLICNGHNISFVEHYPEGV